MTSPKVRASIYERDRFRCRGCAKTAGEVHHMIFRSQGGTDDPSNLVALCTPCHQQAHGLQSAKLPAWVLQAMVVYDKFRVCCEIWKFFKFRENCLTCENRSADYTCLLFDKPVDQLDGCHDWSLRTLSVHS
jgi:HNH endonuclease